MRCQGVHLSVPAAVRGTTKGEYGLISKHVHCQLARCNPLFHFLDVNVLVHRGFVLIITSRRRTGGRHDMPRPSILCGLVAPPSRRQRSSSFPQPTRSHAHRCRRLTRQHGGDQNGLVTLTFDLESGVRVTCDVCYLCANFSLPRPLFSTQARCTRQTDVRRASSLNAACLRGGGRIIIVIFQKLHTLVTLSPMYVTV